MENSDLVKPAFSQMHVAICTLLDAIGDKNEETRLAASTAIRKIAKKHPNTVLKIICMYRQQNNKLGNEHLAAIFVPMEIVCIEHIVEIDGDVVLQLIQFCVNEMIKTVEYIPDVQLAASSVLVALGKEHSIQVMEGLLEKFEVGTVPHYAIPHTMGALASANAFGVLPFVKTILGKMLPLLGTLKTDPIKQAFAYVLGKFSEAIMEYMANIDKAPDSTINKECFYTELAIAYEILFCNWLNTKEPKLLEIVLQSLGSLYAVLSPEKVTEQTPKIIPTLLSMYKKHIKDAYYITQCITSVTLVTLNLNPALLEPLVENLLQMMSELVCISPDYAQPDTVRNHSEVLRCFDQISKHFSDLTVDHLMALLKNNNEKERIKSLIVITHLVNSSDAIKDRIPDLSAILKDLLKEHNIRIKKVLLKAIVTFAYKGCLSGSDEHKFIEFIVKLCCKHNNHSKGDVEDFNEVASNADNTLFLLATSVHAMETTMWVLLLDCFLNKDYSDANVTLLRCLTHLAAKKRKQGYGCTPNAQAVFVHCLSLLANPLETYRGNYVLNFLKNFSVCHNEVYKTFWDNKIPQLLKYLEHNHDDWHNNEWDEFIIDFLSITIESINESKWTESFATHLMDQIPAAYNNQVIEKRLLMKCLAVTLCYIKDSTFMAKNLDLMMTFVRLNDIADADSIAKAIGLCSRSHLQTVLTKLKNIRKEVIIKKSNKFFNFNFIKDAKHDAEIQHVRYTVISCYGEIAAEAPASALLQVVESEILDWVYSELQNSKDFPTRKAAIQTIGNIAEAMHPNRNTLHIQMQSRDKVLELISDQMQLHNGPEYIELYPIILPVLTSLIKLPNVLETEQRVSLLKVCFNNIFNAAAIYCKLNVTNNNDISYGDLKLSPFVFNSFLKLNKLSQEMLMQNLSPATLDDFLTMLEPWLGKRKPEQRLPAIETLKAVLQCYLENMKFAYESPTTFGQTGFILGRVIPRCTDVNTTIRSIAVDCINLVLCISARYEGHMSDHNNSISQSFHSIRSDIETNDPKLLFSLTTEISTIISSHIPAFQLYPFTDSLLDALLDSEASSSSGSSVVLNGFIKNRGGEMHQFVNDVLIKLLAQMNQITCTRTKTSSLRTVVSLATNHPKAVINGLLMQPLPYDQSVCDCWMILASDLALATDVLDQFKKIFSSSPLYEEQQNAEKLKIASIQPLQVICAMCEMFKNSQMHQILSSQYPDLFSILLLTLATYIGISPPVYVPSATKKDKFFSNRDAYKLNPAKIALDTLKMFLLCLKYERVAESLLLCTNIEVGDNLDSFIKMLPMLTENICTITPQSLAWIVASLTPYVNSEYDAQRITVTAFFAELIRKKANNQAVLAENLLESLLSRQSDSNACVRQLSLRGLGYASDLPIELLLRHSKPIISALVQGLDYANNAEDAVPLEAMLSLSKMLNVIEEKYLESIQVTAAVRIKPFYEKDNSQVRGAAFRLFGDLAASLGSSTTKEEGFKEQVNGNFICLLLHLCDEDREVVKTCKYTLRKVAPFLECKKVNSMIQDHLIEEANLHFTDFITDLIKIMAEQLTELFPLFIMTSLSFVKSQWAAIRGHAALMAGLLYMYLPQKAAVSLDILCHKLIQLAQDTDPNVRANGIQGISYLFVT